MLMPKRVKWRKQQRGNMRGLALRGAELLYGEFGLQAMAPGWVTARQIEAARRAVVRQMKRRGKVWIYKGIVLPEVEEKAASTEGVYVSE